MGAQAPQVYAYLAGTHHLGSVDGASRNYDANGNTLTRGYGPQFSYSERNRLAVVTVPNAPFANASSPGPKAIKPTTWFKYFYNGRGERVMMQQSLLLQDTSYVYDEAGHQLGKYLGSSTKSPGEEVIYLDDMPIAMTIGGVLSYLETDHLGTPRVAANPATNALQWEWDFFGDAFGDNAATSAPSGGIDVKLRYPGQYFDAESGLHYNYFRDYEPGTGRYLESDPIGLGGGLATYGYAMQNPLNFADPKGLVICKCKALEDAGGYNSQGIKRCDYFCDCPCKGECKLDSRYGDRAIFNLSGMGVHSNVSGSQICLGQAEWWVERNDPYTPNTASTRRLNYRFDSFSIDTDNPGNGASMSIGLVLKALYASSGCRP